MALLAELEISFVAIVYNEAKFPRKKCKQEEKNDDTNSVYSKYMMEDVYELCTILKYRPNNLEMTQYIQVINPFSGNWNATKQTYFQDYKLIFSRNYMATMSEQHDKLNSVNKVSQESRLR